MLADRVEQDQIKAILVQSMANILRKCLTYRRNFSIEGLIGITLDESEVFLVNIKETIHNSGYLVSNASKSRQANTGKPTTSTPKEIIRRKSKDGTGLSFPSVDSGPKTRTSPLKGKRTAKVLGSEGEPVLKRTRSATSKAELEIKEEPVSADEETAADSSLNGVQDVNEGGNEETETYTIEPIKKRSLWDHSRMRKTKSRKSIPVRALAAVSNSQPVFPEQTATDLGQFLSGMKPILRDIDDVTSNISRDDNVSNLSDALKIDTGSNEEEDDDDEDGDDGQPMVYIDHCIDGELSDNLNLTSEGDLSFGQLPSSRGGGVCMLILDESDGVMCSICNEIFTDQTTCRRHMKNVHKAKVSYRCELCGKRFWHHGDYSEHKMVFHDGPGGYQCQQCGKMLLSKRGLKEHMQHHTGQFPYFCFKCMRGFGRKFEFTGHMKKHHPGDPIAKHPMNVQQVFATSGSNLLDNTSAFCEEMGIPGPSSPSEEMAVEQQEKTHTIETVTERQGLKVIIKKECKTRRDSSTESTTTKGDDSAKSPSNDNNGSQK